MRNQLSELIGLALLVTGFGEMIGKYSWISGTTMNRWICRVLIALATFFVCATAPGCDGNSASGSTSNPTPGTNAATEIHLGSWWVTLFHGGVGGDLTVTDGTTTLTGDDTINFGYGSLGQVGALHSTGAFRPLKTTWAHNVYSIGFGGTIFSRATVSTAGSDLVISTDVGTTYRVQPAQGGTITVTGAKICLITSSSVALAQGALVDSVVVSIPVGPSFMSVGSASSSFGVSGQSGVDSLVIEASGAVEAHNDNLGDRNADDVYVRLVSPPATYSFHMQ